MRTIALAKTIIVTLVAFAVANGLQGRDSIVLEGTGMLPGFKDGQRVEIKRIDRFEEPDLKRGDVIAFLFPDDPSKSYVKRVIGLPGDTVEIHEGKVRVNDRDLDEPYVDSRLNLSRRSLAKTYVRPNYYFVMGDNRDNSSDSRIWGLVPERYIFAKVLSPPATAPRERIAEAR
jgi:signal peptidase I